MEIKGQWLLWGVLLMTLSLSIRCDDPYICKDCYSNESSDFQCNGQRCQAFYWPNSSYPYYVSCGGYQCSSEASLAQASVVQVSASPLSYTVDCYWNVTRNVNSTTLYLYTACNYTFPNCYKCSDNRSCTSCKKGYTKLTTNYSECKRCSDIIDNCLVCQDKYTCTTCAYGYMVNSNYSTGDLIKTCLSCSFAIPGCMACDGRSSCTSCALEYMPIGGLCYQKDGKTLAKSVDYQYLLTNQTTTANNLQQDMNTLLNMIFVALIIIAVLLFLGIVTMCWISRKSTKALEKRSLLSSHD